MDLILKVNRADFNRVKTILDNSYFYYDDYCPYDSIFIFPESIIDQLEKELTNFLNQNNIAKYYFVAE
jgi:hypothetical protein